MKMKALVCFSIASLLSVQAFALEIQKGHLVSTKEWTTGGAKGTFAIGKISDFRKMKLAMPKSNHDSQDIYAFSAIFGGAAGTVGSVTTISGWNNISIYNDSQEAKTYQYAYELCAQVEDSSGQSDQCLNHFDVVQLEAGGTLTDLRSPALQLVYNTPGDYFVSSYTSVESRDGSIDTSSAAQGTAHISLN